MLTFEEFYTLLVQIEAVLNSRPLTPLSSDPNDLVPLTPTHFLITNPGLPMPEPDVANIADNRLNRYHLIEKMRQHFWLRWQKEFVSELQQRTKWKKEKGALNIGDLVIIKEDNLPVMVWKLGRVIGIHPGKDGVVRVAEIKTATGEIKRSFSKICPLPADHSS